MIISNFSLFFKDALKGIKRNITVNIASITAVTATLFVLGLFLLLLINVKIGINDFYSEPKVQVFLSNDITAEEQQKIYSTIKEADDVNDVTFQSKSKALAYLEKKTGIKAKDLLANSENNNEIANSYIIKVDKPDDISNIVFKIDPLKGVTEITHSENNVEKLLSITKLAKWIEAALFLIFSVVSLILINNTMKLSIYSRREEISIIKSLGATDWFIRWPFIFEGMIIGFLGGVAAVAAIYFVYNFAYIKVVSYTASIFMNFIAPSFILIIMSWSIIIISTIVCGVISMFGVKKL